MDEDDNDKFKLERFKGSKSDSLLTIVQRESGCSVYGLSQFTVQAAADPVIAAVGAPNPMSPHFYGFLNDDLHSSVITDRSRTLRQCWFNVGPTSPTLTQH